ncbi:carbohydate-binding domain-containing protein [Catenovulum sp. SM1970]|uniref:family 20 glycosylhydrolase n=1 Tax=Marinifaba aquimaris TaxID=2741323 RepID=UPI0015718DF1|nr:family 20 glycosylhydrolase [Marinifaba aquimaris]NTS76233.1 carbohydate-binding domain-containing protein [Marinifaba aquimaris]
MAASSMTAFADFSQQELNALTKDTEWKIGVVDNFVDGDRTHIGELKITNNSDVAIPSGEGKWSFYFHSTRVITDILNQPGLKVKHINGDLHRIYPTKSFTGLKAGQTLNFQYKAEFWIVAKSDFMPRAFMYQEGLEPAVFANTDTEDFDQFVLPFTEPKQLKRYQTPEDKWNQPTAESRYQANKATNAVKLKGLATRIIPTPSSIDVSSSETKVDASWSIEYQGRAKNEASFLADKLANLLQTELSTTPVKKRSKSDNIISLMIDERLAGGKAESYQLEIDDDRIEITGSDEAGVFYGIQSLLALAPVTAKGSFKVNEVEIEDSPRYAYRGMQYDIGRNFHGKENILKLIDGMATYKLNTLHLHITDDEGWRLEIPGLPELTEIAGSRCFDLTERKCLMTQLGTGPHKSGSGNGFLTVDDFVEILKFAAERHVEVIPEIEAPGHARSQIIAMEARYDRLMAEGKPGAAKEFLLSDPEDKSQYRTQQNYYDNAMNACLPSAAKFMDKVTYELQQMYRQAELKLNVFHVGGDEVGHGAWTQSPKCDALFADASNGVSGHVDVKPMFMAQVAEMAAKRGLAMGAWEDGLMYDRVNPFIRAQLPNDKIIGYPWDNIWEWGVADRAYRLANEGYKVVLAHGTHLYFDHPYEAHPDERGYYWATRFTDTQKVFGYMPDDVYANADYTRAGDKITDLEDLVGRVLPPLEKPENILGMQGHFWGETVRTGEQMLRLVFPRVLAVAERAWHKADWEGQKPNTKARKQQWAKFSARLAQYELAKLAELGINYNLPVPGGVVDNGKLKANAAFPKLKIEYSVDAGNTWQAYQQPVSVGTDKVQLRTVTSNGITSRIAETN